jgi:hypothetical protein
MSKSIDITGRWAGVYHQHGHEHPISSFFNQFDTHLQGKMTDGEPRFERSVFEAAMAAGLPPGADEQIEAKLRAEHPDAPREPILATSIFPPYSTVEGDVRGRTVSFVKRYLGELFSGWRIGDCLIGTTKAGHEVRFRGTLSDDGNSIEGRWWVDESDGPRLEGGFRLQRQEE